MAWQVYELTGSALSLGLLGLARFFPALSMMMVGGVVADTFNRRRIVQVTGLVPFSLRSGAGARRPPAAG